MLHKLRDVILGNHKKQSPFTMLVVVCKGLCLLTLKLVLVVSHHVDPRMCCVPWVMKV